jgi:cell division protein FtsQ
MNATASEPKRRAYSGAGRQLDEGRLASLFGSGRVPAGLTALASAIMLYGLLASQEYTVRTVVVDGASIGDAREIAAAADVVDESIFLVDPIAVARQLQRLPYVAQVEVQASLPDEVSVRIVEREPVLIVEAGGAVVYVDAFGMALGAAAGGDLPSARLRLDELAPGQQIDAELVAALLAVDAALSSRLEALEWSAGEGITARLTDKLEIIFGSVERIPEKLAVLNAIEIQLAPDWSTLDLTEPDRPFTV